MLFSLGNNAEFRVRLFQLKKKYIKLNPHFLINIYRPKFYLVDKIISVIGFAQSIFGILIFITKRPRHVSFSIIAIWLGVMAVSMGGKLFPFDTVEYFKVGLFPILFLHGPLLFLYVSSLTNENFKIKWTALLHALPTVVILMQRTFGNQVSINSSSNLAENPAYIYNTIYYTLLIISLVVYWVLSIDLIIKHRKNMPYYFSNYTAKNTLNWLILLVVLFLLFFVAQLFVSYVEKLMNTKFNEITSLHVNLTIFTYLLIFVGINQTAIYNKGRTSLEDSMGNANAESSGAKQANSALSEKQVNDLTDKIMQYLKDKKPYLNPDYCLQMMVDDLNISRQKLSYVINIGQHKNFYKLINEFRVTEVKEKLQDSHYNHYTVLAIGLDSGFNSKTSFNRIFKDETDLTPTEFRNKYI